jgi:hypothetical protein
MSSDNALVVTLDHPPFAALVRAASMIARRLSSPRARCFGCFVTSAPFVAVRPVLFFFEAAACVIASSALG